MRFFDTTVGARSAKVAVLVTAIAGLAMSCSAHSDPLSHDPNDEGQDEQTACASGATVEGVDVSYYQSNVNWSEVKASGRSFAIVRVSDGSYVDTKFSQNWAGAKAAGLIRGAYQFYRAHEDGSTQANLLLQHMGNLEPGDLPPTLDVEVTDGESDSKIVAGIQNWVTTIQNATGKTPIVYVSPGFWTGISHAQSDGTTLWVANWGVSCPSIPTSWSAWKFWQYSDTGSVSGISGNVDLDRFNGTLAQLQAFANGGDVSTGSGGSCDAQQCNAHCMNQMGCGVCQANQCVCEDASTCGENSTGSNQSTGSNSGVGGGSGGNSGSGGWGGSGGSGGSSFSSGSSSGGSFGSSTSSGFGGSSSSSSF